jgi:agmatinase
VRRAHHAGKPVRTAHPTPARSATLESGSLIVLPFAGIPSFARAPIANLEHDWQSDVGVLGVPFDIALGFRPGARFAPRAIREASLRYALSPEGFYDLRTDRFRLSNLNISDAGDVDLPSLEPELARSRIETAARALRSRVRLPVFLGGDHSISYPLLKAFDDVPDLHVVQIDAHLDFTDVRNETRFSNSSPFRRACEEMPNLKHITTIGLRGLRDHRLAYFDAQIWAVAKLNQLHPAKDVRNRLNSWTGLN